MIRTEACRGAHGWTCARGGSTGEGHSGISRAWNRCRSPAVRALQVPSRAQPSETEAKGDSMPETCQLSHVRPYPRRRCPVGGLLFGRCWCQCYVSIGGPGPAAPGNHTCCCFSSCRGADRLGPSCTPRTWTWGNARTYAHTRQPVGWADARVTRLTQSHATSSEHIDTGNGSADGRVGGYCQIHHSGVKTMCTYRRKAIAHRHRRQGGALQNLRCLAGGPWESYVLLLTYGGPGSPDDTTRCNSKQPNVHGQRHEQSRTEILDGI